MLNLLLIEKCVDQTATTNTIICIMAVIAPLVAGALTAVNCPAQNQNGVRNSVLILVLHSFLTGLLLYPKYDGLFFSAWQLLFWMPAGKISALLVGTRLTQKLRKRFWQIAR